MKPRKTLTIEILGQPWKIKLWGPKQYLKAVGDDSKAICDVESKVIHFDLSCVCLVTARHELTHAYIDQLSFVELQLDPDQWEDFFCELFGKYGQIIVVQAQAIVSACSGL